MPGTAARTLRICSLATLLSASMAGQTAAEAIPQSSIEYVKRLSFGNLRRLHLKGGNGHYTLNGTVLERVSSESVDLSTAGQSFRVRVTFLQTVLISKSRPVNGSKQRLVDSWTQQIPVVAKILKQQDSIGSMKPIVYELIEPKGRQDLKLQEELVLLWSADHGDDSKIGLTSLLPPVTFPGQIVDVQYRGLKGSANHLVGKIIFQILYIRAQGRPAARLGAFLIVSKPSGEYEFYLVPDSLLDRIVIGSK